MPWGFETPKGDAIVETGCCHGNLILIAMVTTDEREIARSEILESNLTKEVDFFDGNKKRK